jgi:methyl-accepting chemotaxis protein
MSAKSIRPEQRRVVYINPKLQGGTALIFAAAILVGAALLAWLIVRDARSALWDASVQGHFRLELTPYQIVRDVLVRHLVVVIAAVLAGTTLIFYLVMRGIRSGLQRVVDVLRISGDGDLSTPTKAPGPGEIGAFGEKLDAIRSTTFDLVREIRADARALAAEPGPPEAVRGRLDDLKRKLARLAP